MSDSLSAPQRAPADTIACISQVEPWSLVFRRWAALLSAHRIHRRGALIQRRYGKRRPDSGFSLSHQPKGIWAVFATQSTRANLLVKPRPPRRNGDQRAKPLLKETPDQPEVLFGIGEVAERQIQPGGLSDNAPVMGKSIKAAFSMVAAHSRLSHPAKTQI